MAHSKEGTGEEKGTHLYFCCKRRVVVSQTEIPFSSHHFFILTRKSPLPPSATRPHSLLQHSGCFLLFCFPLFSTSCVGLFEIILCQTVSVRFPGLRFSQAALSLLSCLGKFLCSTGWPHTWGSHPASASLLLGSQAWAAVPAQLLSLLRQST